MALYQYGIPTTGATDYTDYYAGTAYTVMDRFHPLLNGQTVESLGFYGEGGTAKMKIIRRNSPTNYDVVVDESVATSGGAGWKDVTLASSYTIAATGNYYMALYSDGSNLKGVADSMNAYYTGDLTGTGVSPGGEASDGSGLVPCMRAGYSTGVALPTFSGITSLSDNGDGTLTAEWSAATDQDYYRIHCHTASMSSGELVRVCGEAPSSSTSFRISTLTGTTQLTAGTTYYVMVEAVNSSGVDGNSDNLTAAPSDPDANGALAVVIPAPSPAFLATTAAALYTCPAGKAASVKALHFVNVATTSGSLSLYKKPSGVTTYGSVSLLLKSQVLDAGEAYTTDWPITLDAGDILAGECDGADTLVASAEVVEITK